MESTVQHAHRRSWHCQKAEEQGMQCVPSRTERERVPCVVCVSGAERALQKRFRACYEVGFLMGNERTSAFALQILLLQLTLPSKLASLCMRASSPSSPQPFFQPSWLYVLLATPALSSLSGAVGSVFVAKKRSVEWHTIIRLAPIMPAATNMVMSCVRERPLECCAPSPADEGGGWNGDIGLRE